MKIMNNTGIDEFRERAYKSILEELIENTILDVCFEVHREAKLNFPLPDVSTIPYHLLPINGKILKPLSNVICPVCGSSKGSAKFAGHLAGCMTTNSRKARANVKSFKEWDSNDEDDFDQDDYDPSRKVERNKKTVKGKSKSVGNSVSRSQNSGQSFLEMSYDDRKAFFDQKCGVITKRSKKLCSNSHKCSMHSDMERTSVRN
jgi:RNA polymerase subunit RPABC4/transcription elongation factor Spt4